MLLFSGNRSSAVPMHPSAPGLVLSRPPKCVRSLSAVAGVRAVDQRAVDPGGDDVDLLPRVAVLVPVAGRMTERFSGMTCVPVPAGSKDGSPAGTATLNG